MRLQPDPFGMRLAHRLVRPAVVRWLRCEVTGADVVPGRGGVLYASNHRSFLDHYLLASASPRPMRFLGKRELAVGLMGRFNVYMGMVPVDRGTADLGALDEIVQLLRDGAVIGIFPEGTRSPTGELFRFRSGLARVAADSGAPCIPVGMLGTADVWPRHQWPTRRRPARGVVRVRFGTLVAPPERSGQSRRAFTVEVHRQVAKLCEQPLADAYAAIPGGPGGSPGRA